MTRAFIRPVSHLWNQFFFSSISAIPLARFRIGFSAVVLLMLALIAPDASVWFGERGTLPADDAKILLEGPRVNLFDFLPRSDTTVSAVLVCCAAAAAMLLAGFQTRVASIGLWLLLMSLHNRNVLIFNNGDNLMRNLAFFLMFAPAGAALSLDRRLRRPCGGELLEDALIPAWPVRLLQLQVCVMYLSTAIWKLSGSTWMDGTAVYYVIRTREFERFPLPDFAYSLWFSRCATWSTLAIELGFPILVWFQRFRVPVLCITTTFHLLLEYSLNIPVFQLVALASVLLFLQSGRASDSETVPTAKVADRGGVPIDQQPASPSVLESTHGIAMVDDCTWSGGEISPGGRPYRSPSAS